MSEMLRPADVAKRIGYSVATLATLRIRGGGPPYLKRQGGRAVFYRWEDVLAWMGNDRVSTTPVPAESVAAPAPSVVTTPKAPVIDRSGRSANNEIGRPKGKRGMCGSCRFFGRMDSACHKNVPTVQYLSGDVIALWPPVDREADWCGEWKAREAQ